MIRLRKIPSEDIEDLFFDICIKSKDGCNITVNDKLYHVYVDSIKRCTIIKEIVPDFELTEEELKELIK